MPAEKIKLQIGEPVTVLLDTPAEGEETRSQYGSGVEYRYSVNQGEGTIYLPLAGRDAILRSQAQPGDLIEIEKIMRGRTQQFTVNLVSDAAEPPAHHPKRATFPARVYAHPLPRSNGSPNGALTIRDHERPRNGHTPQRAQQSATLEQMIQAMRIAIDVAADAQAYGREKGVSVTFLGGDIRAIANTLFINEKGGKH